MYSEWGRFSGLSAGGDLAWVLARLPLGGCTQTYWDSRGQTHGVWRLAGNIPVGPMLLCSHTAGHSMRLAHPSRMSRFWQLGVWGRRRDLVPGSPRGGGPSERDTCVSQLFEWPALPCTLLGPSTDASPLDVTPVHSRCRLFTQLLTSVLLLRGCLWSSAFGYHGKIGGPSSRLAARVTTANALLGLTALTTRCH